MKMVTKKRFLGQKLGLLFMCALLQISCDSDDDSIDDGFQGDKKEYVLQPVNASAVTGKLSFTENEDASTTLEIELQGTENGEVYSPKLLFGNAVDAGEIALNMEDIGSDGKTTVIISKLDDNTVLTFDTLKEMDAHIAIFLVVEETETPVAISDIGGSEITEESITYELEAIGNSGIAATVKFEERLNGTSLVTLSSEETEEDSIHPAFIHSGPIGEEQGDKVITLNPLQGGISLTNISAFDNVGDEDGEEVNYEDLIEYAGSLNVYLSTENENDIISQGNIGSNSED